MIRLAGLVGANKRKNLKEQEEGGFDYKYYKDQITALEETLMDFEKELATALEQIADDPMAMGSVSAGQARNQAARYIQGADKQLDGLQKMMDRLESRGEF